MIQVYHYPRCAKSREGIEYLNDHNVEFQTIKYFKDPFTKKSLKAVLQKLGIKPIELVRKNETLWKENFHNRQLSDEEIIEAMLKHPRLIQRPIVVKEEKAVIARPAEKISELL